MNTFTRRVNAGFTVIEMMVALSVLAILIAFAVPTVENTGARSDMKKATDQMAQAFRLAKTAARINNTSVTLTLTTNETGNTVSFKFPSDNYNENGAAISDGGELLPIVRLPENISVTSDPAVFTYDAMGMINDTGTIAIASTINDAFSSSVVISSLMGNVATSYDAHDSGEEES